MAHQLPPLPYDYSALEPYIDTQTMKLHHDMHHGTYVKNLNAALEKYPKLQSQAAEDLLRDLNAVPEDIRTTVRNNGGGHVNHTMFWKIMKPKEGEKRRNDQPERNPAIRTGGGQTATPVQAGNYHGSPRGAQKAHMLPGWNPRLRTLNVSTP